MLAKSLPSLELKDKLQHLGPTHSKLKQLDKNQQSNISKCSSIIRVNTSAFWNKDKWHCTGNNDRITLEREDASVWSTSIWTANGYNNSTNVSIINHSHWPWTIPISLQRSLFQKNQPFEHLMFHLIVQSEIIVLLLRIPIFSIATDECFIAFKRCLSLLSMRLYSSDLYTSLITNRNECAEQGFR